MVLHFTSRCLGCRRLGGGSQTSAASQIATKQLLAVVDTIDRASLFIGYEDRAIVELSEVRQPAGFARRQAPSFSERLDFSIAAFIWCEHNASWSRPKDAAVLFWKHSAGIEHAKFRRLWCVFAIRTL